MEPSFRVLRLEETERLVQEIGVAAGEEFRRAMHIEIADLEWQSKALVPVDFGTLRSSGTTTTEEMPGWMTLTFGYGGAAAPYAFVVHENPRAGKTGGISPRGHPYKTWSKVGQYKYLEQPFNTWSAGLDARIASTIRENLGL